MIKLSKISAVIPAAGKSIRMGQLKILLPWGKTTIIGHIIEILATAGIKDIIVVYDPTQIKVQNHLDNLLKPFPSIRLIGVQDEKDSEMLSSIQSGLRALNKDCRAVLIALADQPQIQLATVNSILSNYLLLNSNIIIPSFEMRKGHPWLIDSKLIDKFLQVKPPFTARDFLEDNNPLIKYVKINNNSILKDIDTPDDYRVSLT